jgi:cation-transporting P-type ATPase E
MNLTIPAGLSSAEVAERIRLGQVNRTPRRDWADYAAIASRHLFTLFNLMVAPAAIALFALREWQAGIAVSGMAIVNSAIGLVQEFRAKRHLDQLAILTENKARVVRDGQLQEIGASDVVLGETLRIQSGDTIVADGQVLAAQFLEVDEALLTGESDAVRRQEGDRLLSGSTCVAGEGYYRADKVGGEAFAQNISAAARRYSYSSSPMTRIINQIITILTFTAVGLCALYFVLYFLQLVNTNNLVLMIAATITSMVPQGLVLTATISFTIGAVVMSRRGALVQRLNAVEAMAAVDVICTDKTGTLTTNRLKLTELKCLDNDLDEKETRRRLSLFACASVDERNRNIQALRAELCPMGQVANLSVLDQIPFKSQNRFSAVKIRDGQTERVIVMGAVEVLDGDNRELETIAREFQRRGLRVLMFAEVVESHTTSISFAETRVPSPLRPLALVALEDELRPEAGEVLKALSSQGIAFKVISGDNADTVRATVAPLNLSISKEEVVTGKQLSEASDNTKLILDHSVFGRVEPLQKVEIVVALQKAGHHVAMIGDGVNDVLPIKKSDLGIAMGEGSQAAKTVSSLVLENNSFAMLPETIEEGRTIVRNLRRAGKLFLVKNVYSFILIVTYATGLFSLPFPYRPQQVTLLNWLVIGIPAFIIALTRERSRSATRPNFLREVGGFALRTGIIFGIAGIVIMALARHVWDADERTLRTMLLSTLILLGITALLRALDDGEDHKLAGDTRVRWLAFAALPAYLLAMYWPFSARFFELTALSLPQWTQVLGIAAPAYALSLVSDQVFGPVAKNTSSKSGGE